MVKSLGKPMFSSTYNNTKNKIIFSFVLHFNKTLEIRYMKIIYCDKFNKISHKDATFSKGSIKNVDQTT